MANDKSFKIKNGLKAGRYLGSNGTETAGTNGPYGVFDTTTYTGNGSTQTITNNVDLSGEGGLVWIKSRAHTYPHGLFDTERGATKQLKSNSSAAERTLSTLLTSFNNNGFSLGSDSDVNGTYSTAKYVAWTFKKQTKFFDVVTYTGNGTAGRTINHSLGSVPGMIIVKQYQAGEARPWSIYHRGIDASAPEDYRISFTTGARVDDAGQWNDTAPTSSVFTVGDSTYVNNNGESYVAYLFAHDTASDSNIKCGSYTGGGNTDVEIDLGWKPSWLLIRRSDATEDWFIVDAQRGFGVDGTDTAKLKANSSEAETSSTSLVATTDTGFKTTDDNAGFNSSGGNYIYVAIRGVVPTQTLDLSTGHTFTITPTEATDVLFSNPPASGTATGFTVEVDNSAGGYALTWPSSVKWHLGAAPTATATKELYTFVTTDGGTTYYGKLAGSDIA
jgi:hypothetical protein